VDFVAREGNRAVGKAEKTSLKKRQLGNRVMQLGQIKKGGERAFSLG